MTRVAVIGNASGGKSTLSRALGAALVLPVYSIDKLQWKPGWRHMPSADFEREHNTLIARDRWIIDGWAYGLQSPLGSMPQIQSLSWVIR